METPDPPNGTPLALKQVVLTPHDILGSLRGIFIYIHRISACSNFLKHFSFTQISPKVIS